MLMLTFWKGELRVLDTQARGNDGAEVVATVTSVEQFNALVAANGGSMQCSSSVDFPEEYTADPAVIALCRDIRE